MNEEAANLIDFHQSYDSIKREETNGKVKIKSSRSIYVRLFPLGIKCELKEILHITLSMTITQISLFAIGAVCLMVAGHIGKEVLAVIALGQSVINLTGHSAILGIVTACDTLISNAFGSPHKYLIGIYLQRALYICPLFCFVFWAIQINAFPILVALHQDPTVARDVEYFLTIFAPALFFVCVYQVLLRYMINQKIVYPVMVIGLIGNVCHVGLQCVFAFILELGITGLALGQVLTFIILASLSAFYIICRKIYVPTWTGWTMLALDEWGTFIKLALSGFTMIAIEWWSFEVGIFMNGAINKVSMSAVSVSVMVECIFYMLPLSFGVAAGVRVGHFLGDGDHVRAKNISNVSQFVALIGTALEVLVLIAFHKLIPYIFTTDQEVVSLVQGLLLYIAIVLMLDCITSITFGVLRASGRQIFGAILNFIGFFCIALPVAGVLLFICHYNGYGYWWGMIIGLTPTSVVCLIFQYSVNWEREALKAMQRLELDRVNEIESKSCESQVQVSQRNRLIKVAKRLLFALFMMSGFLIGLTFRLQRTDFNVNFNKTTYNNASHYLTH